MSNYDLKNKTSKGDVFYYSMKLGYIGTALREKIITNEEYFKIKEKSKEEYRIYTTIL